MDPETGEEVIVSGISLGRVKVVRKPAKESFP